MMDDISKFNYQSQFIPGHPKILTGQKQRTGTLLLGKSFVTIFNIYVSNVRALGTHVPDLNLTSHDIWTFSYRFDVASGRLRVSTWSHIKGFPLIGFLLPLEFLDKHFLQHLLFLQHLNFLRRSFVLTRYENWPFSILSHFSFEKPRVFQKSRDLPRLPWQTINM